MIVGIIDTDLPKVDKIDRLRKILLYIIDSKLSKSGKNKIKLDIKENMATITNKIPDLQNYEIYNIRDYCEINRTKDKCNINSQCNWIDNKCKLQLLDTLIIDFVNKVIEELTQKGIKYKEILQEGDYYVSDIVNSSQYTYKPNQKIISSSNFNASMLL
jgi:hypothetical protein